MIFKNLKHKNKSENYPVSAVEYTDYFSAEE